MGDRRFAKSWESLLASPDRLSAVRALSDADVVSALAASRVAEEPLLSNVLATEAHNRLTRQEAVFESMREGVIVYGPDKRPVRTNAALVEMLGYSRTELLAHTVGEKVFSPADLERYSLAMEEGAAEGRPVKLAIPMRRKDGTRIETEHTLTFLRDMLGNRSGAVMVIRDVTPEKRAVDALARTTRRLGAVLEHTPARMALLDPDYRFVLVNSAYAATAGRSPEAFVGKSHFDLFPDARIRHAFDRVVATRVAHEERDSPFEHPDRGPTWWDWRVEPIADDKGRLEYLLITAMDATHHHDRPVEQPA